MLSPTSPPSCPAVVYSTELIVSQPVLFTMFVLLIICLFHEAENSLGTEFCLFMSRSQASSPGLAAI